MTDVKHTVASLVASVSDDDLVKAIECMYYEQEGQEQDYVDMRNCLRAITPKPTTMNCFLSRHWTEDDIPKQCIHVNGREMGSKTNLAIEYVPWNEWLNIAVFVEPGLKLTDADMLANILYEMTFAGWDEEEIADEKAAIEELIDAIQEPMADLDKFLEGDDDKDDDT